MHHGRSTRISYWSYAFSLFISPIAHIVSFYHIRALRHIRLNITLDCSKNIACSFIGCRLDYANSTLVVISVKNISRLQRLKARSLVLSHVSGNTSASPRLCRSFSGFLSSGIDYKIATVTHKLTECGEPTYLRFCITSKIFRRALRSSVDDRQLEQCSSHTKIGSRAFRCAASVIWNCLPYDIRAAPSVSIFRSRLKTHYLKLAF